MSKYKDAWTLLREVVEETIKFKDEPYTNQQWLDSLKTVEKLYGIKVTRRNLDEIIEEIKEED